MKMYTTLKYVEFCHQNLVLFNYQEAGERVPQFFKLKKYRHPTLIFKFFLVLAYLTCQLAQQIKRAFSLHLVCKVSFQKSICISKKGKSSYLNDVPVCGALQTFHRLSSTWQVCSTKRTFASGYSAWIVHAEHLQSRHQMDRWHWRAWHFNRDLPPLGRWKLGLVHAAKNEPISGFENNSVSR